jgi:hypothetical protein
MGELIFWCGEGNAGATWDELRREIQKEQALRSSSGLIEKVPSGEDNTEIIYAPVWGNYMR